MGNGSPLHKLEQDFGKVMLIDCPGANTFHHVVETTSGCFCTADGPETLPVKMPDGKIIQYPSWVWRNAPCPHTDRGEYIADMEWAGKIINGKIGFAHTMLFTMQDCREILEKRLTGENGCSSCPIRPFHRPDQPGVS
jgi:aminoglycoside N3'-acetyltransferase